MKSTWPGGVDQMQLVGLAVVPGLVEHADRLRLDRDPALALELHRVEQLRPHRARIDGVRQLEDPVGQRRLAVVDVGDDREVADVRLVGHATEQGYFAGGAQPAGRARPTRAAISRAWIWRASGIRIASTSLA